MNFERLRASAGFLASLAFIGLLTFTACSATDPIAISSTGRTFAERRTVPGIPNFALVAPGVARGGQPSADGLKYLKDQGYRTVISFRQHHSERTEAQALGLDVVELPVQADIVGSEPPTENQIRAFFGAVTDPGRQPLYFHCAHGADRTGTFGALYRIEIDGWTNEEAIEEMRSFGYHTVYQDLIEFVRKYKPMGYAKKS